MKFSILILCALVFSFNAFNQAEFAEFTTDTSRINDHMRERISKELWYINGQEMRYDGKTILTPYLIFAEVQWHHRLL